MRGQKLTDEVKRKIMASYTRTGNYSATARDMGVSISSVRYVILKNQDTEEYHEICKLTKERFVELADEVIDLAFGRLKEQLEDGTARINARDLATIIAIMHDKKLIAAGEVAVGGGVIMMPEVK